MRCTRLVLLLATAVFAATATTASALTPADLYVYYPFEETSDAVFQDLGPNSADATFYRPLRTPELPGVDVANVTTTGTFGAALGFGTRDVTVGEAVVSHEVVGSLTSGTNLPDAGDDFAVSFWLNPTAWNAYGTIASYNMDGFEWSIGLSGSKLLGWSRNGEGGTDNFWSTSVSTLTAGTPAHFVMQFSGAGGITGLNINNVSQTNAGGTGYFWGNRKNGLCVGGRDLDARDFTAIDAVMDDFAIIDGTVDSTKVNTLFTTGAVGLGADRLVHYAMDETAGTSTLVDSSGNGNDATLVGYAKSTMYVDARSVSTASETGKFGNAVKFGEGWDQTAQMDMTGAATTLPNPGDAFTVCFWYKLDETLGSAVGSSTGWDNTGIIASWSANGLGFSVGQHNVGTGNFIVRTSDGAYTGDAAHGDTYGLNVGYDKGEDALPIDEYVHFAITVAGDDNKTITGIYVNGVLKAETYDNGHGITNPGTGVLGGRITTVGGIPTVGTDCSGYLDDFAIFKGQLTPTQIADIMTRGVSAAIVPEPSTIALMGLLFGALLIRRSRH